MADNNIALGVQVPDAMKNISGMLNFANQAQQYQKGNLDLQKEQIILGERKGIQQLFQNPDSFKGEDGNPDYNKLINEGMKVAPTTFPTMVPQIIQAHKASIDAQSALNKLNDDQRNQVGNYVMSMAGDDPATVRSKLDGLIQNNPQLKPAVEFAWNYNLAPAAKDPQAFRNSILKTGQSAMPAVSQAGAINPSYQSTGGALQQTNPLAAASGATPSMPVTMAPGGLESTETGPDGQKYIVTRSPQGTILSTRSLAGTGGQATGGGGGMPKFSPGDAEAVTALEGERNQARGLLTAAPIAHTTNRGILEEIDNVAKTGTGGPAIQNLNSLLGLTWGTAEQKASSYDLIGKYMERNALEAAKAMGPGTNAGLEAAIKANGSVAYNPTAIKKITKLNDAIVSGAEMYQPGLEKAIAANPQRGVLAKREFDQAWAQNYDPRINMIFNAAKANDKAAIEEIKKQAGPDGIKELVRKARNIEILTSQGRL